VLKEVFEDILHRYVQFLSSAGSRSFRRTFPVDSLAFLSLIVLGSSFLDISAHQIHPNRKSHSYEIGTALATNFN
jgi:hypothetical protein